VGKAYSSDRHIREAISIPRRIVTTSKLMRMACRSTSNTLNCRRGHIVEPGAVNTRLKRFKLKKEEAPAHCRAGSGAFVYRLIPLTWT
jgi:hypothetical protein